MEQRPSIGADGDGEEDSVGELSGTIKWFSPGKGYGFIARENGEDVFLHFTGLIEGQDRRLFPGDKVVFELASGEKGLKAVSVKRVARADTSEGDN